MLTYPFLSILKLIKVELDFLIKEIIIHIL